MANRVKLMKNNKVLFLVLIGSILLITFFAFKLGSTALGPVQAENNKGFTSDIIQFDDTAIQLLKSTHNETEHLFYFDIENTNDSSILASSTSFKIKNNGNVYSSDSVRFDESRLNPGMSTIAIATFKMKHSDLMEGEPLMEIKRGILFGTKQEFVLKH